MPCYLATHQQDTNDLALMSNEKCGGFGKPFVHWRTEVSLANVRQQHVRQAFL